MERSDIPSPREGILMAGLVKKGKAIGAGTVWLEPDPLSSRRAAIRHGRKTALSTCCPNATSVDIVRSMLDAVYQVDRT